MNEQDWNDLHRALRENRIGRRRFLEGAALLGVSTALATGILAKAGFAATPKKGGTLRLGIGGGSTTDSLDPRTYTDTAGIVYGAAIFNHLIEIDEQKKPAPVLFESWEAKDKATRWVFNIKKGVTFHNGKTLDADDIIYSINMHRGKDSQSGAAENLAAIKEIKKLDANQIEIVLESGDADLDYVLSDYHLLVVPNEFKDFSKPVGTGAYKFEAWDPGVSAKGTRNENYWRSDRGFVEAIEFTVINDTPARMNALVGGQVDAINRVDTSTIDLLTASPDLEIVRSNGGYHVIFAMRTDEKPFDNPDLRKAMKHAINREQLLKSLFNDYGSVGNDHPIPAGDPYFNSELEQTKYDPDKAKFYAKKAGIPV
jgi:peptide/nickel transport system substrate-binding protein